MRITLLHGNPRNYSCNAYLVRGDSNEPEDVNTVVDVGLDGSICGEIENLCTGIGKKKVAQGVLTHGHYDHAAGLSMIVACYQPLVFAFAPGKHVDVLLLDGQVLRLGDRKFEVHILRDIRRIRFVSTVPRREPSSRETRHSM